MSSRPTLITYRSAVELRDLGIRYAYMKAGMHIALLVSAALLGVASSLAWNGTTNQILAALLIGALLSTGLAIYCGHNTEFPHTPRITLEELELMSDELHVPRAVIQQTKERALIGTIEEIKAIFQAEAFVERARKLSKTVQ